MARVYVQRCQRLIQTPPPADWDGGAWTGGGEMINEVRCEGITYNDPPHRFEAGTPPIVQAIGLGAALDYMDRIGRERIAAHETAILQYMKDFDAHFRILPEPLLVTGIGVAFSLEDRRGLAQQLDDTLAEMRADGTMKEIVGRYVDQPDSYLEVDGLDG